MSSDGDSEPDVRVRIGKAASTFQRHRPIWSSTTINLKIKLRLYTAMIEKDPHIEQWTECNKSAKERGGGRRRYGEAPSKKTWKIWVLAGMEPPGSPVTVIDGDVSSPDAPRGTGALKYKYAFRYARIYLCACVCACALVCVTVCVCRYVSM